MKTRCPNCKQPVKAVYTSGEPTCPKCGGNIMGSAGSPSLGVKAGARHSMSDQQHLQMAHDHISAAGANCGEADSGKSVAIKAYAVKRDWVALKNYAMTEASDISSASYVLQGLAGLALSEAMQGEPDDVTEVAVIIRALLDFIGGELDEMTAAAPDVASEGEDMETNGGAGGEIPPSTEYAAMSFNYIKSLHIPHAEQYFKDVLAVKSTGKDTVQGYGFLWGNPSTLDTSAEYFTRPGTTGGTDLWDDVIKGVRPYTWEHGLDVNYKARPVIGQIDDWEDDDVGRVYRAALSRSSKYRQMFDKLVSKRALGSSSDSALQYVERVEQKGGATWLKTWPWFAEAATVTPCEPRMLETVHFKSMGVLLPEPKGNADALPDAARGIPDELWREAQLLIARHS